MKTVFKLLLAFMAVTALTMAESAQELDADANEALKEFYSEVPGGEKFLSKAKAYVVFQDVNEVGFFFGGKYGEGPLRVGNKTKSYHSITGLSAGFQMGVQNYSLIIAFTSDAALKRFILDDDDWETDVETKIIMAEWTTDDDVDEKDFGASMVGFAFDSTGMMGKFSMDGVKFESINPND